MALNNAIIPAYDGTSCWSFGAADPGLPQAPEDSGKAETSTNTHPLLTDTVSG